MFENISSILFCGFSFLTILFAVLVILFRNPVSSAFSLVMVLFNVAALFAIQEAHFAAATQVLVYAGAIAVLFVFVIMLLNIDVVPLDFSRSKIQYGVAGFASISFLFLLIYVISNGGTSSLPGEYSLEKITQDGGNIKLVSFKMFTQYIFAFEIVSILLLLAVVGAIVLAKKKVD